MTCRSWPLPVRPLLVFLLCLGGTATLRAQGLPTVENGFRNIFSQQGPPMLPPGDPSIPGTNDPLRPAYDVQFQSNTAIGGWLTTRITSNADGTGTVLAGSPDTTPGLTSLTLPSGGGVQLAAVVMARPLVVFAVSFALGAEIPRPLVDADGNPVAVDFYLPQPANAFVPTNSTTPNDQFYWSPHAQKVYATQPGVIIVIWRERVSGNTFSQEYVISTSPAKPAKKIYWTENGFNGPVVQIPQARINQVNIVYNAQFPQTVPTAYAPPPPIPGSQPASELRTLWWDQTQKQIRAYNAEGRVFVEYLGTLKADGVNREQLGYEIVEVIKEVRPTTLSVDLGEVVGPQDGDTSLSSVVIAGLGLSANPFLYEQISQGGTKHTLYAIRETAPGALINLVVQQVSNEVLIYWEEAGVLGINWPKYYNGYIQQWPSDPAKFSIYARPDQTNGDAQATGVQLSSLDNPVLVYQSDPNNLQAVMLAGNIFYTNVNPNNPTGYALIRYTNGEEVWFERVYSQLDTTFAGFGATTAAEIGKRVAPPPGADTMVGYVKQRSGTAFNAEAYLDPFVVGFEQAKNGVIIPVNNLAGNDRLEVWWYKKSAPPGSKIGGTYWPQFVQNFQISWPAAPPEIIMASNAGSGDLPSLQAGGKVYYQNDSTKPGYNPNEEHALMLNGRAWALRDDLNLDTSSKPYVLVSYTGADRLPSMAVFKVLREKTGVAGVPDITFNYPGIAGVILQAPMPLPLLPVPRYSDPTQTNYGSPYNYEVVPPSPVDPAVNFDPATDAAYARYQSFTYVDRKATHWIYRGPHGAGTPSFSMRYYYQTQPGFFFPSLGTQPALGTPVPYLRPYADPAIPANGFAGNPVTGTPLDVTFVPQWPSAVPQMLITQTLTLPTQGLPAIRGQSSAKTIYQQSIARDMTKKLPSARLYDPTRAKTFALGGTGGLDAIPASINTSIYLGKTFFPNLPPHLSQRLYFDPTIGTIGSLVLLGQFEDDPVGDKYLLLDVLSSADLVAAKGLCATTDSRKAMWNTAIEGLKTTMETFKENPSKRGTFIVDTTKNVSVGVGSLAEVTDDMTAVDSYAMAASGGGQGYVVLATGDSHDTDFTPAGEPVALQIFQIAAPLNRGQMKVVAPSNPLDEKLTMQHSGDFAGHPEEYDFEWRYQPPVDGSAPGIYSVQRSLLVGDSNWNVVQNPDANFANYRGLNADLSASNLIGLPASFMINDGNGTPDNGSVLPYALLRKQFNFGGPDRPLRLFVSLQLGPLDGAIVYVNGAQVAVQNVAGTPSTTTTTSPGSDFSPLPYLFEIPPAALVIGDNTITVQLYSTADPKSLSAFNARLESSQGTETLAGWNSLPPQPGETLGIPLPDISSIQGRSRYVIGGSGLLTLTDNYYTMRYRARNTTDATYDANGGWSKWTQPQLAEGWIKRALAGINPFQQRVTDLFNNTVDTEVSLVEQAGKRWEGDIPLNLKNINDFGLIEIYETILRRGQSLSINGNPAINYGGANDALLLVAGYLNDLYNIVGNEAYADAADPTIAVGTNDNTFGNIATSLFAFKGEVASLAEEELAMLRGRDDFLQPGTQTAPVYNRLYWNYTRGIASGEAIYALNYNVKDQTKDGTINAADAAKSYPQGHGDAYGHYLTALTGYYGLLSNPNFSWSPRTEAVLVLGVPVQVDYLDERKFASSAAALARTASQVTDLTYRQSYSASDKPDWSKLRDGKTNSSTERVRSWGADEWASRGGQGAYFNWVVGNSLLPAVDPNPTHQGIQIIDRTTVPELSEIVAQAGAIEHTLENADSGVNPLGLSKSALAFDISPTEVDKGKTHYEQIYERAVSALQNAVTASNNAVGSTLFLRQQEDTVDTQRQAIDQQEQVFTNHLIEIYGTPYADDIGPGRTYAQGYSGPDLLHAIYIDMPELFLAPSTDQNSLLQKTYTLTIDPKFILENEAGTLFTPPTVKGVFLMGPTVDFTLNAVGDYVKPSGWTGHRAAPGRIQTAVSDLFLARQNLNHNLKDYSDLVTTMTQQVALYQSTVDTRNTILADKQATAEKVSILNVVNQALNASVRALNAQRSATNDAALAIVEYLPVVNGIDNDVTSGARGAAKTLSATTRNLLLAASIVLQAEIAVNDGLISSFNSELEKAIEAATWENENKQLVYGLQTSLAQMVNGQRGVDAALRRLDQASRDLSALQGEGNRVQQERQTYRQRAAALVQGYRVKDFAFRAFRNEALEKYKTLFELSAQYTYLAARAYDYETGLLNSSGNSTAARFLEGIVQSRALGVVSGGQPQFAGSSTGDPGLSGILATMSGDWAVAKTRLGFNNPDRYRTTFSLRGEKNRLVADSTGDQAWKDMLVASTVSNILDDPDVKRYAQQPGNPTALAQPGIIIPFETSIRAGTNFFGLPLAGGDHTFTPSSFATKIRSTGIAFKGYVGMDSPTTTSSTLSSLGAVSPQDPNTSFTDSNALSATPYIYLIPAGVDSMLSPPVNGTSTVRSWTVEDQAIPLPFNIGGTDFSTKRDFVSSDSLSEPEITLRKQQAFRAVPDGTSFPSDPGFTNARLIGRSVWNTRWKIVIPGDTLLADPQKGIKTFTETVKDIKLHLETYSYSGN